MVNGTDYESSTCFPQTLQHGAGECEGDVDRGSQNRQRQEEVQACQQGSLHFQNVLERRLSHSCVEEPAGVHKIGWTLVEL